MSWQLVSFLILAGVLLGGFAWYERSRPPAQVVSLVAALAALAIVGRIAFAAFPNVKPTTDIVIFAGYALGPAPGFAVGALAALVSNFWFGQGPWTPWQMAGWGLCGILGAGLALVAPRVGRFRLAVVCGLAALGYGAIQNFSLMATYGGELSWAHFWALTTAAIPFEVAHATGNVVLALVAGPAMIRMLIRFRERFEWRRVGAGEGAGGHDATPPRRRPLPTGGAAALLLAVLLLGASASTRAEAAAPGPAAAVAWLEGAQNEDGGYGESPGSESAQAMTGWAMLGFEAAGVNPQDVTSAAGTTPIDYLEGAISTVQSLGDLARTILALEGAGVQPREFGGRNLVAALLAKRRKDGSYEDWPNSTAYAVLALRSAGVEDVEGSLRWLRSAQNEDGGWGDVVGSPSNADGTGAVLQALPPSSSAARHAVGYLRGEQQVGGGFRLGGNGVLNTQSSAWAVQGLLAAGVDPAQVKRGGKSAYEYLEGNQASDGHYRYSAKSDQTPVWVTGEVLVATSHKYLPLEPPPRAEAAKAPKSTSTPEEAAPSSPKPTKSATHKPKPAPKVTAGPKHQQRKKGAADGKPPKVTGEGSASASTDPNILEAAKVGEPKGSDSGSDSGGGSDTGLVIAAIAAVCLLAALAVFLYRRRH